MVRASFKPGGPAVMATANGLVAAVRGRLHPPAHARARVLLFRLHPAGQIGLPVAERCEGGGAVLPVLASAFRSVGS